MTDKEILTAYLEGVSNGKKVIDIAKECGIATKSFRTKIYEWKKAGVKIPTTYELKKQALAQLKKTLGEFYSK